MGTLYTFRFFDGSIECIRDGGFGLEWVRSWARNNLYIKDIYQVSAVNYIRSGAEFFN